MVAMMLSSFEDVRRAREWVRELALAAGLPDPAGAALVTGELGNNCVEHGGEAPGLLRIACRPGRLSLQFENRCAERPDWRTRKPAAVGEFRTGGYGIGIAQAIANRVARQWQPGRLVVRAEFSEAPVTPPSGNGGRRSRETG